MDDIGPHDITSQLANWSRCFAMTLCHATDQSRYYVGSLGSLNGLSDRRIFGPVLWLLAEAVIVHEIQIEKI